MWRVMEMTDPGESGKSEQLTRAMEAHYRLFGTNYSALDPKGDAPLEIPPDREDDLIYIPLGDGDRLSGFNLLTGKEKISGEEQEEIDAALEDVDVDVDEIIAELEGDLEVGDDDHPTDN